MKRISLYVLSFFIPLTLFASDTAGKAMRQALDLYQKGETDRAIQLWEDLRESGYASAALFYNLGNAYYESGKTGLSVLNYERAMMIRPGRELRHNLGLARSRVAGDPLPWPEFTLAMSWRSFRGLASSNLWAGMGGAACWLALLAAWKRRKLWAGAGFLIALVAWLLSYSASKALESAYSVVMEKEAVVRVAPDTESGELGKTYEGWKVLRLDQIGEWVKVELPDGEQGWMEVGSLEEI